MDLLARRRGEACYDALIERGIDAARMFVTSHPLGENMKVDFIPHGSQIANQYEPLPIGVPETAQRWTAATLRTVWPAARPPGAFCTSSSSTRQNWR